MRKSCIAFILMLLLISCQKKEVKVISKPETISLNASDLYSKTYLISPSLNTEKCIAYNDGCDCCDGKIVFLKNNTFISSFYCLPNDSFNTGTFEIKKNKLILHQWNKEAVFGPVNEEAVGQKSVLRLDTINFCDISLDIVPCMKKYIFKDKTDYYSEDIQTSFSETVNQYKKMGVWKLLEIKE